MRTILSDSYGSITNLYQRTGKEIYTVESPLNGITTKDGWTFPCQDILRNYERDIHMKCHVSHNTVHTVHHQKYTEQLPKIIPDDESAKIDEKRVKVVQQIVGGVLYYGRTIDSTVRPGLSLIASEQASATETTEKKVQQLLDYLATHPAAKVRYTTSPK